MNMVILSRRFAHLLCLLLPVTAMATHSGGDNGGDIWVDGDADVQPGTGPQHPDAGMDSSGLSVFVWAAFTSERNDVFLRRFDRTGTPLKDPVMVNTSTEDDQFFPRVAVSADGSFLVVWQSDEPDSEVNVDRKFVRSQAFDADATPLEPELLVNTLLTGEATDISADVAALKGGGYVVVWRSRKSAGDDDWLGIQARFVNADGSAKGGQFQVNSLVGESENYPAVTALENGGFLAVWTQDGVFGRGFMANGSPVADEFQINSSTIGRKTETDVVLGQDGRVLVVWRDEEEGDTDREIRGRFLSQNLTGQGNDFRINTFTDGVQGKAQVGDYGPAGFFVVWESDGSVGGDADSSSIQGRIVTDADQFNGAQFQVNVWTPSTQVTPAIGGRDGEIAVAWRSASFEDESGAVIVGQTWSICGIYCDGFE